MENANDHPFKVSIVRDAEFFANSHPYKVSIEGGGGNEGRVVDELPEEGEPGYIYLVLKESNPEGDIYDEYMWVLQQDGETYGWEHIGATNEVNLDVVKILTQDDYNWNSQTGSATEPYNTIALWLLDDGLYKAPDVSVHPVANHSIGGYTGNLYLVSKAESNSRRGMVACFMGASSELFSAIDDGGNNYLESKFFRAVQQQTGSSTEDLMSQKAITDAINENSGKAIVLTSEDYNYPTNNPTMIVLSRLEDDGLYTWGSDVLVKVADDDSDYVASNYGSTALVYNKLSGLSGVPTDNRNIILFNPYNYLSGQVNEYLVSNIEGQGPHTSLKIGHLIDTNSNRLVNNCNEVFSGRSALDAHQGKVLKDMIDNISGARLLTTADYNWNTRTQSATEPYDSVALWLLDTGIYYKETNGAATVLLSKTRQLSNAGGTFAIMTRGSNGTENELATILYGIGLNPELQTLTVQISNGVDYFSNETVITTRSVMNSLDTTTSGYALDARQGKVLNDRIGQIETVLQTLTIGNGV